MNENPFHRFAEAAAGHPLPVTVSPTISATATPAVPTEFMEIDGIRLAPASRLAALAATRDQHRATLRAVGDRRRTLQDRADDLTRRVRLIDQHKYTGAISATALAEKAQLEADLGQIRAASRVLDAEDATTTAAFGDADRLLRAAITFAKEKGAVLPITLAGER